MLVKVYGELSEGLNIMPTKTSARRRWVIRAVLAAALVLLICMPVVHVDPVTTRLIRPGMNLRAVEAIVGGSPGWYDGASRLVYTSCDAWGLAGYLPDHGGVGRIGASWLAGPGHLDREKWVGSKGEIVVDFDPSGRVLVARFCENRAEWSVKQLIIERLVLRFLTPCDWCKPERH